MYLGGEKIPQQRLPLSKKTKSWREACVEAYIDLAKDGVTERKDYLRTLYDYYNGVIEEDDYRYVLKPYGKTRKNFPSKMRNYPIIKPIIDLLLGEKSKRPLNYTVTVLNSDAISEKEKAKQQAIYQNLQMQFLKVLAETNPEMVQGGQLPEEIPMPEHISEQFDNNYVDNRSIKGQYALNYILQNEEVYDKIQKAWFHFLVAGEVYTHRGVRNEEPFYDILNPIDIDYDKDPDVEFVEDGDWALVRKFVHASTIIDYYHELLTDEQVLALEEPTHQDVDSYLLYRSQQVNTDPNIYRNRLIEVATVYWKSRKRIGFLNYMDPETGQMEEMEVDESFRMPIELKEQGAKVSWKWVNEVWEGSRIDGKYYVNIHPIANQRLSLDNPSTCKLPINGRKYSDINSRNVSLVGIGIPYQLNYNVYKYRLELAIARSKDIIAQFDINMIPKKWDMDKFMHYVEGTGIAWVDYNKEGIQLSPQHQSVLDMSIKTIEQYIVLLNSIMEEWEKISGVNRQRQGQMGTYEGKGTSQQAIVQSSHITEDLFRKFSRLEQRDMQALLDYSKEAWLMGKKTAFVMPDGTTDFLDLNSLSHMESEYGVFVSNSGKDQDKLMQIKGLAQAMVQNGTKASMVAEMFDSESFPQIKAKLKQAEKAAEELEAAQQQAAQQAQQQAMQMEQMKLEQENLENEKDRQKDIEIALINAEARKNPEVDSFNMQKLMQDFENKQRELDIKDQEISRKMDNDADKNDISRAKYEIDREKNTDAK